MYITDVIQKAKQLHPTEYTDKEYLDWCDELSADIRNNYNIQYATIKCNAPEVLLPEGVDINRISKIIMDGHELKKTDLRDFGIDYAYFVEGRGIRKTDGSASDYEIIYALPHLPTRYINKEADVEFGDQSFSCTEATFAVGDSVKVDDTYNVLITDVGENVFHYSGDIIPEGKRKAKLFLEITDKTLLPPPYDTAYMDFVNAKASLYQGDTAAYKTFMGQFNSKMLDYRSYLTRNMPRSEARFINWL